MFGLAIPMLALAILFTLYIVKRSGVISGSELEIGMLIIMTFWLPWELCRLVREVKQNSGDAEN